MGEAAEVEGRAAATGALKPVGPLGSAGSADRVGPMMRPSPSRTGNLLDMYTLGSPSAATATSSKDTDSPVMATLRSLSR